VFTARYALSPYIKPIFVFKGLIIMLPDLSNAYTIHIKCVTSKSCHLAINYAPSIYKDSDQGQRVSDKRQCDRKRVCNQYDNNLKWMPSTSACTMKKEEVEDTRHLHVLYVTNFAWGDLSQSCMRVSQSQEQEWRMYTFWCLRQNYELHCRTNWLSFLHKRRNFLLTKESFFCHGTIRRNA
jgi:hypothetical protein